MGDSQAQTAIKPCPFCQNPSPEMDRFGPEESDPKWSISCEAPECMAIGPEGRTREIAIAKWNGRVA